MHMVIATTMMATQNGIMTLLHNFCSANGNPEACWPVEHHWSAGSEDNYVSLPVFRHLSLGEMVYLCFYMALWWAVCRYTCATLTSLKLKSATNVLESHFDLLFNQYLTVRWAVMKWIVNEYHPKNTHYIHMWFLISHLLLLSYVL